MYIGNCTHTNDESEIFEYVIDFWFAQSECYL